MKTKCFYKGEIHDCDIEKCPPTKHGCPFYNEKKSMPSWAGCRYGGERELTQREALILWELWRKENDE